MYPPSQFNIHYIYNLKGAIIVIIEETQEATVEPKDKGIPELSEGNEAQVLFVLLFVMRHIIDSIMYDHPRFRKEATSGPHGESFTNMLGLLKRTAPEVAEYALFVLRSDKPQVVMQEFNKVLASIYNTFLKVITMEGIEDLIQTEGEDDGTEG